MNRFHCLNILLLLSLVQAHTSLNAQKTVVHGVVLDENSEPMPFVNVAFKHSTVGTITDCRFQYGLWPGILSHTKIPGTEN